MTDFDREERAFRAALLAEANNAPTESIETPESGRRLWPVIAAAAVVVALVVGLSQLARPGDTGGPDPARTPAPSATNAVTDPSKPRTGDPVTAQAIVDDPESRVTRLSPQPDDEETRAVVWEQGEHAAVVITDDGFTTRRMLRVPVGSSVHAAGAGLFVVVEGRNGTRIRIADAGSADQEVAVSGPATSVGADEVPVVVGSPPQTSQFVAVDAASGTAHPVPTPEGDLMHGAVALDGRLMALTANDDRTSTYHWSDDGGRTWQRVVVGDTGFSSVVPTPAGDVHYVVEGADGATVFPLVAVHEMDSSGGGFTRVPYDDGGVFTAVDGSFVWGGELRLLLGRGDWGEDRGLHRFSEGRFDEIPADLPGADERLAPRLVASGADDLWLADVDGTVHRSADGGETWEEIRVR